MLSQESLKILRRSVTFGKWCRSTLLEWDRESSRVKVKSSPLSQSHFWLNVTLHIAYEGFLLYRLAEAIFFPPPGTKLADTINLCYNIGCYALPIALQWSYFSYRVELPAFINGYISFYEEFKETFIIPAHQEDADGCERLLNSYCQTAVVVTCQTFLIFLTDPKRNYFLTSLFTDEKGYVPIHIKLVLLCVQMQLWLSTWAIILLFGFILYVYSFAGITVLREMR
ncbi:unnamed protein product [Allacma fusca]|uniref:Uncharacterized protein n=1 Tax=Allacma fusca TaxID=39272 RepID=A0A8J2KLC0_9HEXA|nr:unnamed protein product [Allacma fusca]